MEGFPTYKPVLKWETLTDSSSFQIRVASGTVVVFRDVPTW